MRFENGLMLAMVCGLCAAISPQVHAENGQPSRQTLQAMGLGSLVVISDHDALAVRGHGYQGGGTKKINSYVKVVGNSYATIGGANGGSHSENGYVAEGNHKAGGTNSSYAGVVDVWTGGKKQGPGGGGYPGGSMKIHSTTFFSGGSSSGWAF